MTEFIYDPEVEEPRRPAHRPLKPIDWEVVDQLIQMQNTMEEIAGYFNMDRTNFALRIQKKHGMTFTAYSSDQYNKGKSNLRSKQYSVAMKGNVRMLERLGDLYLDQKDKVSNQSKSPNDELIKIQQENMELKNQIRELLENANKSETR